MLRGTLDSAEGNVLQGWAFNPDRPLERVSICVYLGDTRLFSLKADRFRRDLQEHGLNDGCHSFTVGVPHDLFPSPFVLLHVRFEESGEELNGSPVTVQSNGMLLDQSKLTAMGKAIAAAAAAAETPEALEGLRAWLSLHHDTIYKRQSALVRSSLRKEIWFDGTTGESTGKLTSVLHDAARSVVERYDTLYLDEVTEPDISVIIPAYNQFEYTYRCLKSLVAHRSTASFEVVLVDDGSTDETIYAALVAFGGIRVIRRTRNAGFMAAVNEGVLHATGRYLFFLNNDTEVHDGCLDSLIETFRRDTAIGVAGSKLLYPSGRLQEAGGLVWRQGNGMNWGREEDPNDPRFCFMRDADYVSGAALMVERALFDAVGGLSPEFAPGYYEDTDLCFKVRAAGRRVVVQPLSLVTHHEGVSAGKDIDALTMKRYQRINHLTFVQKWAGTLAHHGLSGENPHLESERLVTHRALFIDSTAPTPDQDAGSNVAFQYMLSLQRLGYKVSFVGADNVAKISPYTEALEGWGIQCYYRPYSGSIAEILDDRRTSFDLFVIHRMNNMVDCAEPIRSRFPTAPIIYCMADIHHLRMKRESEITADKALAKKYREVQRTELAMVEAADSVVVHSTFEAKLLNKAVPQSSVHVVPWPIEPRPTPLPFEERRAIAFIGGYNHTPNVDAAEWLVEDILPLVWEQDDTIECLLIGSQMPQRVTNLARPGVEIIGHLPDLQPTLNRLRLTVAPLRYGAGLKGKVLTSFAAGLPCIATECAVEGMNLPQDLRSLVAETAEAIAARILAVYRDRDVNLALAASGLDFIRQDFSRDRVDELLRSIIASTGKMGEAAPKRGVTTAGAGVRTR